MGWVGGVMAVRGLAAALTGGWFRGGSGRSRWWQRPCARARRARPVRGRRAAGLLPPPSLTAPASAAATPPQPCSDLPLPSRDPSQGRGAGPRRQGASLRPGRARGGERWQCRGRRGSHSVPPPRAAPCVPAGNMWRRGEQSRAGRVPRRPAVPAGGGGWRRVAVLLAAGATAAAPTPLHQAPAHAAAGGSRLVVACPPGSGSRGCLFTAGLLAPAGFGMGRLGKSLPGVIDCAVETGG